MRPIKFRAINKKTGKMVFWDLLLSPAEWAEKGLAELNRETIGQFTGLHDKNGTEIYEGDILEHNETRLTVDPIIPVNRFYGNQVEDDWMSMSDVDWEVIGNIYENHDLLTQPSNAPRIDTAS